MRNMQMLFNTGRLAGSGYLSILPVDQGIEHAVWGSSRDARRFRSRCRRVFPS
jgi:DhnA family fructose-bisphosphate aldolase class Ia